MSDSALFWLACHTCLLRCLQLLQLNAYLVYHVRQPLLLQVIGLMINQLSRRFEFQADNFAVKLGHAPQLREALKKLDSNNKSATNVDPWYSAYHYSHPPLLERLNAIDVASKKGQ